MTKSVPDPDLGPVALEGLLDRHERQGVLDGRIVVDDWAAGIEETTLRPATSPTSPVNPCSGARPADVKGG